MCAIATARFHVSGLPAANGNNNDKNSGNPINELKTAEATGGDAKNNLQVAYLKAFKDTSADETGYVLCSHVVLSCRLVLYG